MATAEEIQAFISQPGVTDAQIAAAMQEFNVTPEQVAAATSVPIADVQSRYDAARYENMANQLYQEYLGRAPEADVAQKWQAVGGTEEDLRDALRASEEYNLRLGNAYQEMVSGAYGDIGRTGFGTGVSQIDQPGYDYWVNQLKTGAIAPEDFRSQFSGALTSYAQANPNDPYTQYVSDYLVSQGYKDVFGREAEDQASQYWKEQLITGKISPLEFEKILAQGATGAEDRIKAQQYLGNEYFAPEEFLKRTGGIGYQEVVDYVAQNLDDPTKIYQRAQEFNVNPSDVIAAMQAKGYGELATLSDVEKFFQQGQEGFGERYDQILEETFGSDEERARIEQILGMKAGDLERLYDPSQFSKSSIEKIEETLQSTRVNKIQDALITKAIAKDVLGYTDAEMKTVVSDLAQGKEDDPILKDIFDSLKSGNRMTKDEFESLMIEAAKENPKAEIFQRKPELGARYLPIEPAQGLTGQYGYYNNAPVLNMSALDRYLKDSNQTKLDLGESDFGWATNSKYMGEVRNGASVFGVKATPKQIKDFDKVEQMVRDAGGLQTKRIDNSEGNSYDVQGIYQTRIDWETNQPYKAFVTVDQLYSMIPGYDSETGQSGKQSYEETRKQLETAAQKLNIDPRQFGSTKELFDAVQDASKDLYLVVGRAQGWDPAIAGASGITVTDGRRGGVNHAAVLYQRFGDKGLAIQAPQSFGFDDPKKKSFWQELASVPFIAELALLNPATAAWYPAIKGAQSAIQGGDIGDVLKNVALSYAGQSVLPQIAPDVTASIGNTLIEAGIPYDIAGTLADAGTRVALNTGMSVAAGADLGEAAERSLLSYGVSKGVSGGLSLADFPKEFQPEVARLLTEGIVTGNFQDAAKNAVMRYGGKEIKNIIKDENRPMSTGPTMRAARGGLAQASQFRKVPRMPRRVAPIRRDVRKLIPLRKSGLAYFRT